MPLIKSPSKKAFTSNLKAEIGASKPQKQAIAIAYAVQRRAKRAGGGALGYSLVNGSPQYDQEIWNTPNPLSTNFMNPLAQLTGDGSPIVTNLNPAVSGALGGGGNTGALTSNETGTGTVGNALEPGGSANSGDSAGGNNNGAFTSGDTLGLSGVTSGPTANGGADGSGNFGGTGGTAGTGSNPNVSGSPSTAQNNTSQVPGTTGFTNGLSGAALSAMLGISGVPGLSTLAGAAEGARNGIATNDFLSSIGMPGISVGGAALGNAGILGQIAQALGLGNDLGAGTSIASALNASENGNPAAAAQSPGGIADTPGQAETQAGGGFGSGVGTDTVPGGGFGTSSGFMGTDIGAGAQTGGPGQTAATTVSDAGNVGTQIAGPPDVSMSSLPVDTGYYSGDPNLATNGGPGYSNTTDAGGYAGDTGSSGFDIDDFGGVGSDFAGSDMGPADSSDIESIAKGGRVYRRDIGGPIPSNVTANPLIQGYQQRFAQMNPEQLQEYAIRAGGSPIGQMAQRVLMQKRVMPQPQQMQQQIGLSGLNSDALQTGLPGTQMPQQQARGGVTRAIGGTIPSVSPWLHEQARLASSDHMPIKHLATGGFLKREDGGPVPSYMALPNPSGLVAPGNIDLNSRPVVKNPDGSVSTVRSITVTGDNGAFLLPTVSDDGRIMSNPEAIQQWKNTGRNLGQFDNEDDADSYAMSLHNAQAKQYVPQKAMGGRIVRHLATGGVGIPLSQAVPSWTRNEDRIADQPDRGLLASPLGAAGGRSDTLPHAVATDSYVLPADVVSGLGEGDTLSGAHVLDAALHTLPYGIEGAQNRGRANAPQAPRPPILQSATGGSAGGPPGGRVPVLVASGEYIVHPDEVRKLGGGNIKRGHKVLDSFVKQVRSANIKTLSRLPGPVK